MRPPSALPTVTRCLLLCLFASAPLLSQDSYRITPNFVTLRIGEQRNFRMVDQRGRVQQNVTWTISDAGAFSSTQGDEVSLVPRQAGHFRLTARTDFAVAEGEVNVVEGYSLEPGTVQWASGAIPGCANVKIIPAARVAGGPDFYQQTRCGDGEYITAYRSDGVQLWRTKISNNGLDPTLSSAGTSYPVLGNRLDTRVSSICDSVSIGMEQSKIREMLGQGNPPATERDASRSWIVDEPGSQCLLWFDSKLALEKKRKVYVTGDDSGGDSSATRRIQEQRSTAATSQVPAAPPAANGTESPMPAHPAEKAKHVITNDDIKPSPFADFGGRFYSTTGSINDCDASCFDQVHVLSHVDSSKGTTDWRREVLKEIDLVRSSGDWQGYLHQVYDAHSTICQLKKDRQDELNAGGMRRNIGAEEIAIAEKYDLKDKTAQNRLAALNAEQQSRQQIFRDKSYANAFATLQGTRMQSGTCAPIVIIYHQ